MHMVVNSLKKKKRTWKTVLLENEQKASPLTAVEHHSFPFGLIVCFSNEITKMNYRKVRFDNDVCCSFI